MKAKEDATRDRDEAPYVSSIRLGAAAILSLGIAAAGIAMAISFASSRHADRTVTVRGLAEREVDADLAVWPVTFSAASDSLEDLKRDVAAKTAAVRSFLTEAGIAEGDISSTPPMVRDAQAELYIQPQGRAFRYIAQATVLARTRDVGAMLMAMKKALDLVGMGVAVSKEYDGRPQFSFAALNSIKPEMIAEATRNARAAAEQFALDSGSRVGKIRSASQGLFSIEDADASLPQRKTVRVVTTVEYLLAD